METLDTETMTIQRDHLSDVTIRFADPETNVEFGTLGIVWKPRFFGRWGRYTPRVSFTGHVEKTAKELFRSMLPFMKSEEAIGTYAVKWVRPDDPVVFHCTAEIGTLIHRLQAAIRLNGEITVRGLKRLS